MNDKRKNKNSKAMLLGMGFDNNDGHARVTKGEEFCLLGGSAETHERMTETAIKFTEKLSDRGKRMCELSKDEFIEILMESTV